jgi:midasin (ATPase involved in ribosome maturation)
MSKSSRVSARYWSRAALSSLVSFCPYSYAVRRSVRNFTKLLQELQEKASAESNNGNGVGDNKGNTDENMDETNEDEDDEDVANEDKDEEDEANEAEEVEEE